MTLDRYDYSGTVISMSANLEQGGNVVVFDHNSILNLLRGTVGQELPKLGNVDSVTLHHGRGKKVLDNIQCRVTFSEKDEPGVIINRETVIYPEVVPNEELAKPIHPIAVFLNSRIDEVLDINKYHHIPEGFVYIWQVMVTYLYVEYDKDMILEMINHLDGFDEDDFAYNLRCSIKKFIRENMGYIFPDKEHELEVFGFCSDDDDEGMSSAVKRYIISIVPELCASFTSQPSG